MTKPNGIILWEGASLIDGAPIVVIATGLASASGNEKTGAMVQTWIMRSDIAPHEAIHTGDDASVCGACPLRGAIVDGRNKGRACYVKTFQAPRSVYDGFKRGIYPAVTPESAGALLSGRALRFGSYGNPSAAPFWLWNAVSRFTEKRTGYIHNWRTADLAWRKLVMASVESAAEMAEAQALGYRTFRVRTLSEPILPREVICPASAEAGKKTSCFACAACGGNSAKAKASIVIAAHGSSAKAFAPRLA
jgi:hypothetical protein